MSSEEIALGLRVGNRIHDRYEILGLLGKGGFAAVFRAHDSQIERDVAIKVLNVETLVSQGNDLETMLIRFKREAKTSAQINHPSVVQIFDFGVLADSDRPFIIMELLDGHDLEEDLKIQGTLDPRRFLPLFVDTLEALGDAHQRGIVHKDIKPSNLFIAHPNSRREILKLVDFGIAHIAKTTDDRLTKTGYALGTPQYMAPEYVEEQFVSPALDVYQMGLVMVEALAGRGVIDETNPWKCALMHVSRELSVPTELLKSPLGPIIEKALALKPEDRYQTAAEFADALALIDPASIPKLAIGAELRRLDMPSSELLAPRPNTQEILSESATNELRASPADITTGEVSAKSSAGADPGFNPPMQGATAPGNTKQLVLLFVVLLIGVASVIALIAILTSGEEALDSNGLQAEVDIVIPEVPSDDGTAELAASDEPDPDEESPTEPAQEPRVIDIRAVPSSAIITVDGERAGRGQVNIGFRDEESDPVEVTVTHDDYLPMTRTIGFDSDSTVEFELERRPAPTTTTRPTTETRPTTRPDPEPAPEPEVQEETTVERRLTIADDPPPADDSSDDDQRTLRLLD